MRRHTEQIDNVSWGCHNYSQLLHNNCLTTTYKTNKVLENKIFKSCCQVREQQKSGGGAFHSSNHSSSVQPWLTYKAWI